MHGKHTAQMASAAPTRAGQDAFGALQEIVRKLEADPNTDWSKPGIGALQGFYRPDISLVERSDCFIGGKATEDPYLAMPHEPLPSGETVEAAISKVLAAEREARESVVACRRQAEERLEIARREARLISERCERRMQAIRQGYAQALAQRLSAFQDESNQFKKAYVPTAEDLARLRHAVATLAGESTGDTQ